MKKLALILVGGLLVGCTPKTEPEAIAPTQTDTPAAKTTGAAAAPAKELKPFEWSEDSKVYVFATADALMAFREGKPPVLKVEKPELVPTGKVVIEAADQAEADQIAAGYAKMHPAPVAAPK